MNADQKSLETVFSMAICRQWGDKWQLKTDSNDFLSIFIDSINVFVCRQPGVILDTCL